MLRVAIVHYHLRPGGVTRVIRETVEALSTLPHRTAVIVGDVPDDATNLPELSAVVPELDYADFAASAEEVRRVAAAILEQSRSLLGGPPDVIHVHNHTLAKNPLVPLLVRHMAEQGQRLLLHVHDFAEDGRPGDYQRILHGIAGGSAQNLAQLMYPSGPHVHYAVLNRRDHDFLAQSGVPPENLHYLPNPVRPLPPSEEKPASGPALVLYPTRGIRRKNLGEFLLWAAVTRDARFATTLEPANPLARQYYLRWVATSHELKLPVDFGIGSASEHHLADLFARSTAIITTSVAEGFGLAFIEPWVNHRPLVGRDIPEITAEFRQAGMDLELLYPRLDVPLEWVGREDLCRRLTAAWQNYYAAYGRAADAQHACETALEAAVREGAVDFGRLDEHLQEKVLRQVAQAGALPPGMPELMRLIPDRVTIEKNRQAVLEHFSLQRYGQRLLRVYEKVAGSATGPVGAHDAEALLSCFLKPERFFMIRT